MTPWHPVLGYPRFDSKRAVSKRAISKTSGQQKLRIEQTLSIPAAAKSTGSL
jgi:hypothetical protein